MIEKEVVSVGLLLCLGEVDSFGSLYNYDNHRLWPAPRPSMGRACISPVDHLFLNLLLC
jgi:hypothetical protein